MVSEFTITDDVSSTLLAQLTEKRVLDRVHALPISSSHQGICDHS